MSKNDENRIIDLLLSLKGEIGILKGDVQGVHKDVKRINGGMARHEEDIDSLKETRDRQRGAAKVVAIITGGLVSLSGLLYFIIR